VISKFVQCKGILSYTVMMTHTQYNAPCGYTSLHAVTMQALVYTNKYCCIGIYIM